MDYTTEFEGAFELDKPLSDEHAAYLNKFRETRRYARDAKIAKTLPDPIREAAGLPIGDFGEYFVGGTGFLGQDRDASTLDSNIPPPGQPDLWCHWLPTEDHKGIKWDEGEKFRKYVDWIKYIIKHFLKPWGYTLNGSVLWNGVDVGDTGRIIIVDNVVERITY